MTSWSQSFATDSESAATEALVSSIPISIPSEVSVRPTRDSAEVTTSDIWGKGLKLAIRLLYACESLWARRNLFFNIRPQVWPIKGPLQQFFRTLFSAMRSGWTIVAIRLLKTPARAQRHGVLHTEDSLCLLSERDHHPQQGLHLQRKANLAADRGGGAARLSSCKVDHSSGAFQSAGSDPRSEVFVASSSPEIVSIVLV